MKPYLAIFMCRLSALFQYRAAAIAGLCTQIFWGFVKIMILEAFYAQSTSPQPISLEQAITFVCLGQALLQLVPWTIDKEIEAHIKNGNVAYELIRPLDLYWHWFFRSMALRLVPTFMRCFPLFLVAGLFMGLSSPESWTAGIAFGISVIFSVLLSSAISTLVVITLFWTISGEGLLRLLPHIAMALTGLLVPLPLFPDWMQPFLSLQPFRGVIDIPSRLYTGVIPANDVAYYLGFQILWTAILIISGKWLMSKATRRFVIQGG